MVMTGASRKGQKLVSPGLEVPPRLSLELTEPCQLPSCRDGGRCPHRSRHKITQRELPCSLHSGAYRGGRRYRLLPHPRLHGPFPPSPLEGQSGLECRYPGSICGHFEGQGSGPGERHIVTHRSAQPPGSPPLQPSLFPGWLPGAAPTGQSRPLDCRNMASLARPPTLPTVDTRDGQGPQPRVQGGTVSWSTRLHVDWCGVFSLDLRGSPSVRKAREGGTGKQPRSVYQRSPTCS